MPEATNNQGNGAGPTSADLHQQFFGYKPQDSPAGLRGGYLNGGRLATHELAPADESPLETLLDTASASYEESGPTRRQRVAGAISRLYHQAGARVFGGLANLNESLKASSEKGRKTRVGAIIGITAVGAVAAYALGANLISHSNGAATTAHGLPLPGGTKHGPTLGNGLLHHVHLGNRPPISHPSHTIPGGVYRPGNTPTQPPLPRPRHNIELLRNHLGYKGDTIDHELRGMEPKNLSARAHNWLLHKVMRYNHESVSGARHMRVGTGFKMPKAWLNQNYIGRHFK